MLPIALRPDGRRAVIVGGGNVAHRKAEALIAAGLEIFVVAPYIAPELQAIVEHTGGIFAERPYEAADLAGATLVVAATDDDAINALVIAQAREARVLACDAIAPERGDFTMLATVRVGDLTFTVDSGRGTPAFSKRLMREISERFGPEYGAATRILARMRTYIKAVVPDPAERTAVLRILAELPIEELAHLNPIEAEHEVEATIELVRADGAPKRTSAAVCASRGSALALTQSKLVAARLAEGGIASRILIVSTTGDRVQDRPLVSIGSVSIFVKELELALREEKADYAVHSCKDLPSELPSDMRIAAISLREDARDAFCSERYARFEDLPAGAIVGTSSPRRRWQLEALRADLQYADIRGNVDTRLRKLREGEYDAIVLAMAGLNRLNLRATHTVPFPIERMMPAVAQGALAVETRANDDAMSQRVRDAINDPTSELCVSVERAALRKLRAGCEAPVGIYARIEGGAMLVDGVYAIPDRGPVLREHLRRAVDTLADARRLGDEIGERLVQRLHAHDGAPKPLHGRLVVLPRTQDRPSTIASALRARGADVIEISSGDAGPAANLTSPHMLVFPSSGSVEAARVYLDTLRGKEPRPFVAAMGPLSAAAAGAAGFIPDAVSPEASIDAFVALISEHLQTL